MRSDLPINADLHIDFLQIFLLFLIHFDVGNEVFFDKVEAVEFLDGEQVAEILNRPNYYNVELFLSLENGFLGLIGGSKQLPAWEFG